MVALPSLNLKKTCFISTIVRLMFMIYGEWQDATMAVKYTDIDYEVFTDASRHVVAGKSPYERATYRYTPLLALMLVPNITIHKAFGKLLFVFCDIVAGCLIHLILTTQGSLDSSAIKYSWLWFFNPMIITVSTRGNAESVLAVLVLSTVYFTLNKHFILSAVMLAFSVHFKIYPVIYSLPLYLTVGSLVRRRTHVNKDGLMGMLTNVISYLNHPYQMGFAFISGVTFLIVNGLMYYIYGYEFLEHSYLYHVTRKDVKHNFSVYFYMLYLTMDSSFSWVISLLAFIPQLLLVVIFGIKYYEDLPFCCFLQTFVFVTFNKVCTSQYFLWYLSLLPLIFPRVQIKLGSLVRMLVAWCSSQAIWLGAAYLLEFQGVNTLLLIWAASVVFFITNIWILYRIITSYLNIKYDKKD